VDRMIEDPTIRAVCIREVQKSLRESAYRLIGDKITALGVLIGSA
jgi:phage terminase large subunit